VSFGMQIFQKSSFSLYFKNTVLRVSLFFTFIRYGVSELQAHANVLKHKSETREPAIFSLKIAGSIARGSSPYQAAWEAVKVLNLALSLVVIL
jgi:hypothetical protein